ncbi:MAG: glutaredoxin domain-containing protein, partial [Usitatibacter sp.]
MQSRTAALCIFAVSLAAPLLAGAQSTVYRWVDKDGKVQFSDAPPPPDAKDATQRRLGGGDVEPTPLPYATQAAAKRNPVSLYTATSCADACSRARDYLSERGIPFTEHDAQANPADRAALKDLIGSYQVPVLVVGTAKVKGFEEGLWSASLDEAGYPSTRLPGQPPTRPTVSAPPPAPAAAPPAAE